MTGIPPQLLVSRWLQPCKENGGERGVQTLVQARVMTACRAFVEVGLDMYLEGISLSEMEAMMAVARLESGGQLVGPLQQEILLSWSAMVFLTLQAIGLPLRPSGVGHKLTPAQIHEHHTRMLV